MSNQGWIPYSERTKQQRMMSDEFAERVGRFELHASPVSEPDRVIFEDAQKQVLDGELLLRINQVTGSCVGCGSWQANINARVCDIAYRGENEKFVYMFPFATYGVGRQIAGMRTKGEGSFGAAQAKAVHPDHFGWLRMDDKRFPQPTIKDGWIRWTEAQEMAWSHPSVWPISLKELAIEADPFGTSEVTRITSIEEAVQALAQGRPITCASMLGFANPRVMEDVLVGDWDTQWAHQMSWSGYWKHSKLGLLIKNDNQWNDVHGRCPTLGPMGINGTVWLREKTLKKLFSSRDAEVFAHSAVGDFETRELKWEDWSGGDWQFAD
jgi:hypothetical protein